LGDVNAQKRENLRCVRIRIEASEFLTPIGGFALGPPPPTMLFAKLRLCTHTHTHTQAAKWC
jgi:hypothetical protein